ncbi:right-handed parallel beta-helix repeat-containing protein [Streptomyces otsuchiensis]|uniref:right-handed parallel beta-helix repeat-containing protein n=1 Tax=Streptomyces otsuchiensis TaxID=2681388 RepID=UPI001D13123C|nr:right-handed parallel beta-helix repeat-containing protein [Streptomyces otsuchiensis]
MRSIATRSRTVRRPRPARSGVGALIVAVLASGTLAAAPVAQTAPPVGAVTAAQTTATAAAGDLVWEAITFGQSTDLNFASNVLPEKIGTNYAAPEHPGTIDGRIVLESRGGKLAQGHDGLTFYQTTLDANTDNFVLTADMTVEQFGPETGATPNSQDSAGIMIRDVNGAPRQEPMVDGFEEVPAASNIFGTGMMRHGVSGIHRTGVVEPWGNPGSELSAAALTTDSRYALPVGTPVSLRLERTDTEFVMSATFTHAGEPATFERRVAGADWVQDIDPDRMHVGFYAARNAKVSFDNANLELSEADTQPRPPVETAPEQPALALLSPAETSTRQYTLQARPNYAGTLTVTDGTGKRVAKTRLDAHEVFSKKVRLRSDRAEFTLTLTPSEGPSTTPVSRSLTVEHTAYGERGDGRTIHASPAGTPSAAGTASRPVDLPTALKYVAPGGQVLLHGGTYEPAGTLNLSESYSGVKRSPKTLKPYRGASVVIDGREALSVVLRLDADHWRVEGFRITRAANNAMRVSGSHNTISGMTFNHNGNTGFQLSGSGDNPDLWPSHNLIVGSESHDNRDASDIDADGFAAKLGVGAGNVFRGNISHHNIDDGWDLYNRTNEGPNMPITLENNVAYANGRLSDGHNENSNLGNGFKLGGEGLPVNHVVRGNIAYDNNMDGFTDNFNPGQLRLSGNTSFDNKRFNYLIRFSPYFTPEEQGVYRDNLSFRTATGRGGAEPAADFISGDVDRTNVLFDGQRSVNGDGSTTATAADFRSLVLPGRYERAKDGTPLHGDFLRPARKSELNKAGTKRSVIGALDGSRR